MAIVRQEFYVGETSKSTANLSVIKMSTIEYKFWYFPEDYSKKKKLLKTLAVQQTVLRNRCTITVFCNIKYITIMDEAKFSTDFALVFI